MKLREWAEDTLGFFGLMLFSFFSLIVGGYLYWFKLFKGVFGWTKKKIKKS